MKKIKFLLLSILIVAILLPFASCSKNHRSLMKIPTQSENFSKEFVDSFFDEYICRDLQLYYLKIEPYEVRIDCDIEGVPDSRNSVDYYFLSTIVDVPRDQFIAVTAYSTFASAVLPFYSAPYVFQRKDAPTPMKDYTISSVSIVGASSIPLNFYTCYYFEREELLNYFEVFLNDQSTIIFSEYTREENLSFVNSLQDSYSRKAPDNIHVYKLGKPSDPVFYYLLFRFEEVENLVWFVPLYWDREENFYYGFSYYDVEVKIGDDGSKEYIYEEYSRLAPISEEAKQIIKGAINLTYPFPQNDTKQTTPDPTDPENTTFPDIKTPDSFLPDESN